MKPMTLNLSKMKKVAGDKNSSTFLHQDGHQIVIAHNALPHLQRKQLEKLPLCDGGMLANGGAVKKYADGDMVTGGTSGAAIGADSAQSDNPGQQPPDSQPQAPEQDAGPVQMPSPQDSPQSGSPVDINQAYTQGQNAIDEKAKVAASQAAADAKIQQDDLTARQNLQDGIKQNLADFAQEKKNFEDYVKANPIDPNHYQENLSSGQKVANAIGLLFGGFKQGFAGGNNPALDWINNQINRDIEGQKSRMDQQKTLLGANQDLYQDEMLANNATRVGMNDIYDHKIQLAASKLGTPAAKAAADAAHSQFALQNAGLLQQMAIRATALHASSNGGGGLADPSVLVPGLVPEARQKDVFDEIKNAQNITRNGPKMLDAFDKASHTMSHVADYVPGMENVDQKDLHQLMLPNFKSIDGTVRQAAMDESFKNITPQFGDNANTLKVKRQALIDWMSAESAAPTSKGYNLDLSQFPTTRGITMKTQNSGAASNFGFKPSK